MIATNVFARGILDALFPPACAACGRRGRVPFCLACADALEPAPPFAIEGAAEARALWLYGGPAKIAIQRLKYDGRPELGVVLGAELRPALDELGPIDAIVPVPLSKTRAIARGYNQARELARALNVPVRTFALARSPSSREQVGLDKAERLANLDRAFLPGSDDVRGASLALVDDVVTTGATASSATRALLAGGAKRVIVLALARTA